MDLYNFYRGLENVIDTLQKDRHDLTMKDYLVMCDPFFNVDFYDEKYLNRQIGGGQPDKQLVINALEAQEKIGNSSETQASAAEAEIQQGQEEKKADAEKEAQEAAEEAKKAAKEEDTARKTMKEKGKAMKNLSKKLKTNEKALLKEKDESKRPALSNKINQTAASLANAKKAYEDAQKIVKEKQAEKQKASSKAESAKAVSDEDVADAAADLDKEVDEMAPIKKLIKTATKVVVVFAMIVCLPIVPWILISFYSFKKLYGLYISYIQTY